MIESITLKFGAATGQPAVRLDVAPVTVFVGPNNSGKSKVLQELNYACSNGSCPASNLILNDISFQQFEPQQQVNIRDRCVLTARRTETINQGNILVGRDNIRQQVAESTFTQCLANPNSQKSHFAQWVLRPYTLMLNGNNRLNAIKQQKATDLQQPSQNFLDILFRDDSKRLEVRRIAHEAFGKYFVVDPTSLGNLRIRYSEVEPSSDHQERGIHDDAVQFHANAEDVALTSDGVKAFTGIITQIIAGDPSVMLIDEPEAFLHPALSYKLGREIAISAAQSNKRLFVSTHSSNFIMGCVQSGAPINIVRLTYLNGVATARTLPKDKLLSLMRNPLLRSTGVLDGLFYESVIVTEADADRAFYEEVNSRLLRFNPTRGIPNCLFLNAQNKTTIHQIINPLRALGIPAAGIVDVDILKDGGKNWTDFLSGGYVPDVSHAGLGQIRSTLRKCCDDSGKEMKRDGGINVLGTNEREAAENLFGQLATYGLFVVQGGELESWLRHLGATGHGPKWLIETFEKMGEDSDSPGYAKPVSDDVWGFIESVGTWLKDPRRRGIPAT